MEILLSVGCILAFLLGAKIGRDNGVESTLSFLREKVHAGMAPYSVFQKAYGLSGMYLSNVSPKLKDMPLVVISSANFLELIALQKASIDATQDEIEDIHELTTKAVRFHL